jgi:hypothetical protein
MEMKYVLITLSGGIIDHVAFFDNPQMAAKMLSDYVRHMNTERDDAALYSPDGLVANAKDFLDDNDEYVENRSLADQISEQKDSPIYIIGNPNHPLGFMVASTDDPLGFHDPLEALSVLGEMRRDFGGHLKLYQAAPLAGPVAERAHLESYTAEQELEDFDCALVKEYLV